MSTNENNKIIQSRVKGALYGFAIGDAMGATTEFLTSGQIRNRYEIVDNIIGGGWLNLEPGQVTDDTQMTLCVSNAIKVSATSFGFEGKVIDNFVKWYQSNPLDVGGQCSKAILSLMNGIKLPKDESALGNGSLMRALPCALIDNLEWNYLQSRLTHNASLVDMCIETYHRDIVRLIKSPMRSIVSWTGELLEPTGHVFHTLNNAIYWSGHCNTEDAIVKAVNNGGDADTIAAITGSLSGARYGFESIPKRWIEQLDIQVKNELDNFAEFCINLLTKAE